MRQLWETGWMHNRVRMIVASFLTKDLLIDWREGERVFMEWLIDGDPTSNNGGWQWAASTGSDAQPYFRIFNPVTQGRSAATRMARTSEVGSRTARRAERARPRPLEVREPAGRVPPAHRGPRPASRSGARGVPACARARCAAVSGALDIRIGVSSCLLGAEVRFDGGHKRDRFVTDQLGEFVEWTPFCPELEAGLGVPRPAMRLVEAEGAPRLVETASGRDHTDALEDATARQIERIGALDLCGYVLKRGSPSCGMERTKVYRANAMPSHDGVGVFARALLARFPALPVEEEGRLNDPVLRENFIERVFAYRRLKDLFGGPWRSGDVVAFHTRHKLQLLAHSRSNYDALGRAVASVAATPQDAFEADYTRAFMQTMAIPATRGRNTDVLQHAAGHLKHIDAGPRRELADLIHDYRNGFVPLVVPITMLRHHARVGSVAYLCGQTYLEPHPKELMLRNHV